MVNGQWFYDLAIQFPAPHVMHLFLPVTLSKQPICWAVPLPPHMPYGIRPLLLPNPSPKSEYIIFFILHASSSCTPLDMSHHPLLRFLFSFVFSALFLPCTICHGSSSYQFCQSNAKCGNTEIQFPFGIKGNDHACGDPHFPLVCRPDDSLLLIGTNNNYSILHTSLVGGLDNNERITIVNEKGRGENSYCDPSAFSIGDSAFYTGDLNPEYLKIDEQYTIVTFLTDCPSIKPPSSIFKLNCGDWYYYHELDVYHAPKNFSCEKLARVPVRTDRLWTLGNLSFLQEGFQILWSYPDADRSRTCEGCFTSGGSCGYNISDGGFLCYCKDGPKSNNCHDHPSSTNKTIAAIGKTAPSSDHPSSTNKTIAAIVGSVAGVAMIAIAIMLLVFYKRRKSPSNRGLISDMSPDQSNDMESALPARKTRDLAFLGNFPVFSYEELREATDGFAEHNEIGDGGFGSVYLGRLWNGRAVAVKRLYQDNSRRLQQFLNEVKLFSSLHHRNLVRLFGCSSPDSPELLLVYEYVPNGTLADHLHGELKGKGLLWNTRLNIAIETAQALAFLHGIEPPIFHRDVKSSNILLDENFTVKLADFGLSRLVPLDATHVTTAPQGTPGYLDPDYHQCYQLTEKSDVYSFGVVLLEIISAKLAVDITRERREIGLANMAITKIRSGALHELVDPTLDIESNHLVKVMVSGVAELAMGCLAAEKDDRPHMQEVVAQLEQIKQTGHIASPDKQPATDRRSRAV